MNVLPWLILTFLLFTSALMFCLLVSTPYPEILNWLKSSYPDIYDVHYLEFHFTNHLYKISRYIFGGITIFLFSLFPFLIRFRKSISAYSSTFFLFLISLFKSFFLFFHHLSKPTKITLGVIIVLSLIYRIVFLYTLPPEADEVFSYVYFARYSPWVAAFYYPEPNNHIFYNLLASLLGYIISDPLLVMRIPPLLFLLLSLLALFVLLKKITSNDLLSLIGVSITAFSLPATYYSLQGRGYIIVSFFTLMCLLIFWQITIYNRRQKFYYILFGLNALCGLYTIPVFLFPLTGIAIFCLFYSWHKKDFQLIKEMTITIGITGIFTFLLYLPVIAFNGWDALFNNKWVKSQPTASLIGIFKPAALESLDYIFGVNGKGYILLALIVLTGLFLILNKQTLPRIKTYIILNFSMALAALVLMLSLRVFPPYRTWTYFTFLTCPLLTICVYYFFQQLKLPKIAWFATMLLTLLFIFINIKNFLAESPEMKMYIELKKNLNLITQRQPQKIFFKKHDTLELYLRYELLKQKNL